VRIAATVILALLIGIAAQATSASPRQAQFKLFEVRIDGKGRRALFAPDPGLAPDGVADVSRDGTRVLFVNVADLYTADIDGSHRKLIASSPNILSVPVFSPDGRRVAFEGEYSCTDGECYERDIWLVNVSGSGLRRFVKRAIAPSWSEDSRKLAYLGGFCLECRTAALTLARASGPLRPRELVPNEQAQDGISKLLVSPRGDRVAYARDGRIGHEIRIARLDGRTRTFKGDEPSWSPDGTKIAFVSSQAPTSVYVGRPGGRRRWLAVGSKPVWSPNGRRVAFVHGSRCGQLSIIRPSGRGRRQLTHDPCGASFDIWWTADSKRLIYQRVS
jgi:Tol biopolymer transport system component